MTPPLRRPERAWCDGNRFALLSDGALFFPEMLAAIEGAREYIALEMYLAESGSLATRFIDALCAARTRGVTVLVLLDDFGTFYLANHDRQRLSEAGVHVTRFNPLSPFKLALNLVRDHRKLLLIDDRLAYVGGAGLTTQFDPDAYQHVDGRHWHDTMVRVEGPCVAQWWSLFRINWRRWSHIPCPQPAARPAGSARGRVIAGRRGARVLTRVAVDDIRAARRRIYLCTPYFLPTRHLRVALARAAERGVDVRLLLPGPRTDHASTRAAGQRNYGAMLRRGVRILEYQPTFLHAKLLLTDDRSMVGSCNFDRWSERWNLEANQAIDDAGFADELATLFASDFADSREITWQQWRQRPWWARLRERFWSTIELWALRLTRRSSLMLGRSARRRAY